MSNLKELEYIVAVFHAATMYSSCFSNFRLLIYFQIDYIRCCINITQLYSYTVYRQYTFTHKQYTEQHK
jgi:hypothetical protein